MRNKKLIVKLFNINKLGMKSFEFYNKKGYIFICNDGKICDMVRESEVSYDL